MGVTMQNKTINLGHLVICGDDGEDIQNDSPTDSKTQLAQANYIDGRIGFLRESVREDTIYFFVIAIWRPNGMKKKYNNVQLA